MIYKNNLDLFTENDIMINKIISAMRSGLSIKALSFLQDSDQYLSIKQMDNLINLVIKLDFANILKWILNCSIHRFDLKLNIIDIFYQACDKSRFTIITMILTTDKYIKKIVLSYGIMNLLMSLEKAFGAAYRHENKQVLKIIIDLDLLTQRFFDEIFAIACGNGHNEMIRLLIETNRINLNVSNELAIYNVCRYNNVESLKILLADMRVDPSNPKYRNSDDGFILACRHNNLETVKILLPDDRIDPSSNMNSALTSAISNGYVELSKILLDNAKIDPSYPNNRVIRRACKYNRPETIKLLLSDKRVDPASKRNRPIQRACEYGNLEIVKMLLLDERVDPSDNFNKALCKAVMSSYSSIVELLLSDKRVNPSDRNNKAIYKASKMPSGFITQLLLADDRVDPSALNNRAIKMACKYANSRSLKILLADKRINLIDDAANIISYALTHGSASIIQLLASDFRIISACDSSLLKRLHDCGFLNSLEDN